MGARLEQWKARGHKAAEVGGKVLNVASKAAAVTIITLEAIGELQSHHRAIQESHGNATGAHREGRHWRALGHHAETAGHVARAVQTVEHHSRRISDATRDSA